MSGGQQRELVAVRIRGSVLFICSMKASFSFCRQVPVYTESDWIEVKPYFIVEKCAVIIFNNDNFFRSSLIWVCSVCLGLFSRPLD